MILRPLPMEEVFERRVALELFAGAGVGMVAGGALCGFWYWKGSGTKIAVLGVGDLLSVLVTHDHRRILVAAGDDGETFRRLLSPHLPLIGGQIDLLLIDPRSSDDVVELAVKLGADETLWLPIGDDDGGSNVLRARSRVQADDGFEIVLDPGVGGSWQATVVLNGDRVMIVPAEPPATALTGMVISLGGPIPAAEGWSLAIGPTKTAATAGVHAIADGRELEIELRSNEARVKV